MKDIPFDYRTIQKEDVWRRVNLNIKLTYAFVGVLSFILGLYISPLLVALWDAL